MNTIVSGSAPFYVELLNVFKINNHGWLVWPDLFIQIRNNLNIHEYVRFYENETAINYMLCRSVLTKEELEEHKKAEALMSDTEKQQKLDGLAQELCSLDENDFEEIFGFDDPTPEQKLEVQQWFSSLSESKKKETIEQWQFFFIGIFCTFHNYLSVMVNGEKLTSLVPKALAGDDEAFLKAIKIDRNLLFNHPYFMDRMRRASETPNSAFSKKLNLKQTTPNFNSKIRYPGLYFIFSMLDLMNWLDELKHKEILNICDSIGLDRWQNRIEDVNAVTKQLLRYRHYQSSGGLSMQ